MQFLQQVLIYISTFLLTLTPAPEFVEGVVGQPRSFLPSQTVTQHDKTISSLIYRGLFEYDIYGTLVPNLAETWEISEDGMVYKIKIKDNQYWSDGSKITSNDLIYSAYTSPDLNEVATDKVDDLTVMYTLPNKFSPFLSLLTTMVMQEGSEDAGHELDPVSSGQFRVVRVERNGPVVKQITLWNNDQEQEIRKLVFRYYANEEEVITAANLGEIEGFIGTRQYKLENFDEYKYPLQGVHYSLYFNLRNDKFADVELRQKLEKVLPVEDLILPYGIFVEGPISRSVFTERDIEFNKYDKTFKGTLPGVSFTITVPDVNEHVELVKQIEQIWESKLGITVDIKKVDPTVFYDEVIKDYNYEVLFYGQEVGRDPDRYVSWHSTQKEGTGLNLSGFSHVRADRALEEGRNEVDNNNRIVHYTEFQKVLTEQVPAIFLYHPYTRYYINKFITGVGDKYTFSLKDRFMDFSDWKTVKTL
ncbi:MAG: extracellular solute-binding protein family 5, peptide/nickel transport system substrate-binding protein [candidate division WWE3 bacterium GW2011_GWC1_41_7]|uniref:Extracellular solute-binding protein family 5, peptide/nickel transport system substrate-binding protein n=1 Tax=candidate division WWE3 bacterium GW2011_GWC1_41_7 TaxID=1619119 RepID=A0A0G0ZCJ7_UNCKA|nr:MAG: extracellular solute-binding protein family 5, peptide/nickel transport system substrate-binding protein [candidate division WWE3 bacterium GW2011_GWC1_41_7]